MAIKVQNNKFVLKNCRPIRLRKHKLQKEMNLTLFLKKSLIKFIIFGWSENNSQRILFTKKMQNLN